MVGLHFSPALSCVKRFFIFMASPLVLPLASLNGWSLRRLAEQANVNKAALSAMLRGESGQLSEKSLAQLYDALGLDERGEPREDWVYRWQLGDGCGSTLDLKTLFNEIDRARHDEIEQFLLLEKGEESPGFLAFRSSMGLRALVYLANKCSKPKKAAPTTLHYPTPKELGNHMKWGIMLDEGSQGIEITPDQVRTLRDLYRPPEPSYFDGILLGEQRLIEIGALKPFQKLTWDDILQSLQCRYHSPDIAGFFLQITSSGRKK